MIRNIMTPEHNVFVFVSNLDWLKHKNIVGSCINSGYCQQHLLNGHFPCNLHGGDTHTHTLCFNAIFPGEPGLAGCPLNSPSAFIPGLCILLGEA